MGIICGISVSLLVVVAGLFLLAKTKKEQLNNTFTFASFTVIILGILLMIASVIGGMCHVMSSKCGERSTYQKHHSFMMGDYGKGEGSCYKMQKHHGMQMCCKEQKGDKMHKWGKSGKCRGGKTCDKKNCDRKGCSKKHIDAEKEIEEEAAEE